MKRVSFIHTGLRVAVLAVLALPLAAAAPKKAATPPPTQANTTTTPPGKPTPTTYKNPKLRGWINDTPDTGQFLADSVWLLRVGPRVTKVEQFVERWYASYPEDRPGQDSWVACSSSRASWPRKCWA